MDRRQFLVALGAAAAVPRRLLAQGRRKPNIIWIMADDLGAYDLGCTGQKRIRTPHIDRIAAQGMRFTQCYAGSTVCAPSRSVLMTGQHTGHTTVRGNFSAIGKGRVPLRPQDVTVAEVLKQAGYTTGIVGKWGLGEPGTPGIPSQQGFDFWFGYLNQRRAHEYYPEYLWRNTQKVVLEGNRSKPRTDYSHDLMTEEALGFVRRAAKGPFFLYLAYTIPHGKYQVPSVEPYTDEDWSDTEKRYAAMVTRMDRDVGRLMTLLAELGLDRDTVVFFTSDNGAARRWKRFESCGPLRGYKRSLHEGGIRVPMVVQWPGRIPAGTTSDLAWAFWDFLPTAAALAGVEPPEHTDGISVLPALLGREQPGHEVFYWEFLRRDFAQALRMGRWKGIRYGTREPLELYDLEADPGEASDVAAKHPDVVRQIEARMAACRTESKHWPSKKRRGGT
ncbi:MAG: arylsulfatase [Candidatus Brocadiia bacterium]